MLQRQKVLLRDTRLLGATEGRGSWNVTWEFWELHVEKEWAGSSTVSVWWLFDDWVDKCKDGGRNAQDMERLETQVQWV